MTRPTTICPHCRSQVDAARPCPCGAQQRHSEARRAELRACHTLIRFKVVSPELTGRRVER